MIQISNYVKLVYQMPLNKVVKIKIGSCKMHKLATKDCARIQPRSEFAKTSHTAGDICGLDAGTEEEMQLREYLPERSRGEHQHFTRSQGCSAAK